MEILLGLVVLLGGLMIGVRHGGIGLAVINGIAVVIFTFVFGYKPGKPPIDVMLIILAVVTCAGTFFLPNYPSDLATIGFDRVGTTKIGGLILNHSFMIPGMIEVVVG